MSRIGKRPVGVPKGVEVTISEHTVRVKGPKGDLKLDVHPELDIKLEEGQVVVERPSDSANHKALHGLTRTLVSNMMAGVTSGFSKTLEIVGVGYRAEKKGGADQLTLSLGYSHQIQYRPPTGVTIDVPNPTTITVRGADKQTVGQVAADIRAFRPPEPYKGKGIRYQGEQIRRKAGKTAGA
jgi:large subunit ribosomal protein L6